MRMSVGPATGAGHSGLLPGQRLVTASRKTGPWPDRHNAMASLAAACTAKTSAPSTRMVAILTDLAMLHRSLLACTSVGYPWPGAHEPVLLFSQMNRTGRRH